MPIVAAVIAVIAVMAVMGTIETIEPTETIAWSFTTAAVTATTTIPATFA